MNKSVLGTLAGAVILVLAIMSCVALYGWINRPDPTPPAPLVPSPTLRIEPSPNTYNTVGQQITFNYIVTNNGTTRLQDPVTITDSKVPGVVCPASSDGYLDIGETITCKGIYVIQQADITNTSMTNTATASAGGQISSPATATIKVPLNPFLTLTKTANATTFSQAGQVIRYTYVITNTSTNTLGPTQFTVSDTKFPAPINCGPNTTTLGNNQTVTCTADYTVTAADVSACQIVNSATATGAGAVTAQAATVTIRGCGGSPASNLTPGATIYHRVEAGEWLLQISRCYGANFDAVRRANPRTTDPDLIFPYPSMTVTVPNIGSNGFPYGPPCITIHTVVAGDTWQSIANAYNADVTILQAANRGVSLTAGNKIKVPKNSKQGGPYPTPLPPTAVPPTAIPPTTAPIRQPVRLSFPPGSPASVTQTGTLGVPDTIRYVFTANAGQILSVQLTVPTNDISMGIYAPNNAVLKQPDLINSWSGTLTLTGDYAIDLISSVGQPNKTYTLVVTLTTPTLPPPASPVERVADIAPGSPSSSPSYLMPFNAHLYFQANANDGAGAELWRYDRGLNAVSRAADIYPGSTGSDPASLRPYSKDSLLYFSANGNDGTGTELWRFNGSATGRVNDLFGGGESSNPAYITEYNGALYFSANGNDGAGVELWRFDGNTTVRVADINPGPGDSKPSYLAVYNNVLYFNATTTSGGTELWKYDGTNPPTLAADLTAGLGNGNPSYLAVFSNLLYFSADGGDGSGIELWKYDGTNPPTLAKDINPGPNSSAPTFLTVFNNVLYFGAVGDSAGFELWKFDGTNASRVADINPTGSSNPAYLAVYNNELYFQADANDGAGKELWKFKGP